jgi:hypothetical protein
MDELAYCNSSKWVQSGRGKGGTNQLHTEPVAGEKESPSKTWPEGIWQDHPRNPTRWFVIHHISKLDKILVS